MNPHFLPAALLWIAACSPISPSESGCSSFDSEGWQNADTRSDRRGVLADNLIQRCKLHGKTSDQIVALLGEPTKTNYFENYDLVYVVGPERGFIGIDYEWLVFELDENGKVANYELVTD